METHLFSGIYEKSALNFNQFLSSYFPPLHSSNFSSEAQNFFECSRGKNVLFCERRGFILGGEGECVF
jgi:hypothetical protein